MVVVLVYSLIVILVMNIYNQNNKDKFELLDFEEYVANLSISGYDFNIAKNADGTIIHDGFFMKINSYGMRDYEYSLEKPENTFRIAILGDSFTFGFGEKMNETYPKLLETSLRNKYSESNIEVLNFGGNGHNTFTEYLILTKKVVLFEPDLIILGYFLNDPDYDYDKNMIYFCLEASKQSDNTAKLKEYNPYKEIIEELNELYRKGLLIKGIGKEDYQENYYFSLYQPTYPGWKCTIEAFNKIGEFSEQKIPVITIILPGEFRNVNRYDKLANIYKLVEKVSKDANLTTLNLYEMSNIDSNTIIDNEVAHYNYNGNKLVTELLMPEIEKHSSFKNFQNNGQK